LLLVGGKTETIEGEEVLRLESGSIYLTQV